MLYERWARGDRKSQLIYHYIRECGSLSKQDIVIGLKLSLPTITQNINYLAEMGLVDSSGKILNTGGRSATAFSYIPNARVAIGVYLTANHINVISVDLSGNIVEMENARVPFNLDDDDYLRRLGELVELVKRRTGVSDENLLGVGVAVQGLVSDDGEEVIYGLTLNFTGKKREQICKYIPYKNRLFHDSEVGGHAEVWINHDIEDAFYISLSNSVGGAVIMGVQVYPGDSRKGGEIGHMVVVPEGGKRCYCGKYGCFDTVCRATNLSDYSDGSLEDFFALLQQGDAGAQALWTQYLYDLSLAIHNVRMLFNCKIIVGGYIGAYIEDYMDELRALTDERNPFDEKAENYLLPCKYQVEASAAGAAISYIEDFFQTI